MHQTSLAATQPPTINEHFRSVIALPINVTFYDEIQYIAITWDALNDGLTPRPRILHARAGLLPYLPAYRLIDLLCDDRAKKSVDGTLRVQGRAIRPETYLGLWRTALAEALTPTQFAARWGLRVFLTVGATLEPARSSKCSWTSSPFPTFEAFEALHGSRFLHQLTADGRPGFALTMDLREPDAARDAFYAEALLSENPDAACYVRTRLAPIISEPPTLPLLDQQSLPF